jgi:hypothetical protein
LYHPAERANTGGPGPSNNVPRKHGKGVISEGGTMNVAAQSPRVAAAMRRSAEGERGG